MSKLVIALERLVGPELTQAARDIDRQMKAKLLNAEAVKAAILDWPGLYEAEDGRRFQGMPVSQVPSQLVSCGWRNVSRLDEHDFRGMGLEIVTARYVGGASPKRFCRVVVAA